PGEGPNVGGVSPRFRASFVAFTMEATLSFMNTAVVCQPEAHSPPKTLFFAASASRWNGCGSYFLAKSMISSAVNLWLPMTRFFPRFSSRKLMMHLLLLHRNRGAASCMDAAFRTRFRRAD